jgi:very-short-patch-repair endonuclease
MEPIDPHETSHNGGKAPSHREIAALADRQHGVVATSQLRELGLGRRAIEYRIHAGQLHRIHRGVYAVGRRTLTRQGQWMAAVLAYGPDAVASHRTAAAIWELWSSGAKLDVTTPRHKRSRKKIRAHTATLYPEDITVQNGIPVTSVARTILDLAEVLSQEHLTRVIENAVRAELFDLRALDAAIARRPGARGVKRLKAALADYRGAPDLRSKHERYFRRLIARAGLPTPQFNVLVQGILVDVYWPDWKLIVEIDSVAFHATPTAFEQDRIRDAELQKAGYRVLRITEKRLYGDPQGILRDILQLARV